MKPKVLKNIVAVLMLLALLLLSTCGLWAQTRPHDRDAFTYKFNDYQYVGLEIDPNASIKEDALNWTARAGVVWKPVHLGISYTSLENLHGVDYKDVTVHLGKVWYPTQKLQIITGVKSGGIIRKNAWRAYYGFDITVQWQFTRHLALTATASLDRRSDWPLFGWSPGFRETTKGGLTYIF